MAQEKKTESSARRAGAAVRRAAGSQVRQTPGRVARGISTVFPAAAAPIAAASDIGRVILGDFLAGLAGEPAAAKAKPKPAAPAQPASRVAAADAALAQGRAQREAAAEAPYTPYERQLAAINDVLSKPYTLEELSMVSQLLPDQGKPASQKDIVLGRAAAMSRDLFQTEISQIRAAVEAGEADEETGRALVKKATSDYFARDAGLAGFNPVDLETARRIAEGSQQE